MYSQDEHISTSVQAASVQAASAQAQAPRKRMVLRWLLVACVAAFIFYMSSRTAGQLGTSFLGQVKDQINTQINTLLGTTGDPMSAVSHFCEYLVLGVALANALRSHIPLPRACVVALVCASAYGVTDEFHQLFVQGRYCDPLDWLTDTCGASLGSALFFRGKTR